MEKNEIKEILLSSGAFLEGHFLLTSGRHSDKYVEKIKLIQDPSKVSLLCNELAKRFFEYDFNTVVSPAMGGIVLGYEVAKFLKKKFIFSQRKEGRMTIRSGFSLQPTDKVLIIEDIVTTGGSVFEVIDCVKIAGAKIVGIGLIVDRSDGKVDFGYPTKALLPMNIKSYTENECPLCKQNIPLVKPGASDKKL
ncbi:MAG: orotate phosphoribosyltransferase [Candidatus Cloacimonadota bacterium]|nr:orotate phosphoribosyltransferase [Candidatus Cloacimonadota bacterium]